MNETEKKKESALHDPVVKAIIIGLSIVELIPILIFICHMSRH